jgi:hypothetical protein
MSIETRMVAEFYARLFPWIDHSRDILVCRDNGGASETAIADLCFHFLGASDQLRLEFKTLYRGPVIGCTPKQMRTWQVPSIAAPQVWIAIEGADGFHFWRHEDPDFVANFRDAKRRSNGDFHVVAPATPRLSMPATFVEILKFGQDAGMLR